MVGVYVPNDRHVIFWEDLLARIEDDKQLIMLGDFSAIFNAELHRSRDTRSLVIPKNIQDFMEYHSVIGGDFIILIQRIIFISEVATTLSLGLILFWFLIPSKIRFLQ